jgi:hypothetical protein
MFESANGNVGAAEGNNQKECREAACPVAKKDGAGCLQGSEVEFAAAVDTVHREFQSVIGSQQIVTAPQVANVTEIRKFQIIAADGVAKISKGQITAISDTVQSIIDQLVGCDLFRDVGGYQPHVLKSLLKHRPHALPHLLFRQMGCSLQKRGQSFPIHAAQTYIGEASFGTGEVACHEHFAECIERTAERALATTGHPLYEVDLIDGSLVINTDFLEVVEQFFSEFQKPWMALVASSRSDACQSSVSSAGKLIARRSR